MTFYSHPDPTIRQQQAKARETALRLVHAGRIGWGKPTPAAITDGFVDNGSGPRCVDLCHSLTVLIALHELREAGRLYIHKDHGTVRDRLLQEASRA